MITRVCSCGKKFNTYPTYIRRGGGKYCSQICAKKSLIGHLPWWVEKKSKNPGFRENSKNPMWKGNGVGLHALHNWVKRRMPKPNKCENCEKNKPYDLANKGVYDRKFKNWWYLCRRCHMEIDGRLKNFINSRALAKQ